MRIMTLGIGLALTLACAPAAAQDFRWTGTLDAGQSLEVRGLNAGIEATPADGRSAEVVAVKEARRGDPERVDIEVVERADGVLVCAIWPGQGADDGCPASRFPKPGRGDHDHVEVEFRIRVPADVRFAARTVNGGIQARGLTGDVDVTTVNGGIDIATSRAVEAKTVNGSIDASIGVDRWSGTLSLETVNGPIVVTLPAEVDARVRAETVNGGFQSAFPLTVEAGQRLGPRRVEGTLGEGGGLLELETVNGSIEIERG